MKLYVVWVDFLNEELKDQDELTLSRHPFIRRILEAEDPKIVLSSEERNCLRIAKALLVGKGYRLVSLKSAKEIQGIEELMNKEKLDSYLQGGFFPNAEGVEGVLQRTREVHKLVRKATTIDGAVALVLPKGLASFFLWKELPMLLHPEELLFRTETLGGIYFSEFPKPYEAKEL